MPSFVSVLLGIALLLSGLYAILYLWATKNRDVFKKMGVETPPVNTFTGNIKWQIANGGLWKSQIFARNKYGKVYGIFEGNMELLVVNDLDFAHKVMFDHFDHFTNRKFMEVADDESKYSVSVLTDDHWKSTRRIMTPTFSGQKMRQMESLMHVSINQTIDIIRKNGGKSSFHVKNLFSCMALDIVGSTAFGIDLNTQKNPDSEFSTRAKRIMSEFTFDMFTVRMMLAFPFLMKVLGLFVFGQDGAYFINTAKKMVEDRKAGVKRDDFMQLLVDLEVSNETDLQVDEKGRKWTNKGLTRSHILGNTFIFLLAAFETTATVLTFFCFALAHNPKEQAKLRKELKENLGDSEPSYDSIKSLEYLEAAMNESMRLYSPIFRVDRECSRDITIHDIDIPKGIGVAIACEAIHHDPDIWPDPMSYKPERFLGNRDDIHPCAFLPFGAGQRQCLGIRFARMEIKFTMAKILSRFEISIDKTRMTSDPMPPLAEAGFRRTKDPIYLNFKPL